MRARAGLIALSAVATLALPAAGAEPATAIGQNGQIAYASNRDGNDEIYLVTHAGSRETRLTNNNEDDSSPAVSIEGLIAFVRPVGESTNIFVVSLATDSIRSLTSDIEREDDPAWSPIGSPLAYTRVNQGQSEIYEFSTLTMTRRNLTRNPANDMEPAWSPSGTRIAFVSDRGGTRDIYVMNADGSSQKKLVATPVDEFDPVWSPDGRIAFSRADAGNLDIWSINADGTGERRLTAHSADDIEPAWSPDGRLIAFASNRDGNFEIYVMSRDESDAQNYSNSAVSRDLHPSWETVLPGAPRVRGAPKVVPTDSRVCTRQGGRNANALVGKNGVDFLCGNGGRDIVDGRGGNDHLWGDNGNDILVARDGELDIVEGGRGRDRAYVDRFDEVVGVETKIFRRRTARRRT